MSYPGQGRRFRPAPTLDGYEVVDETDGRPVGISFFENEARTMADDLNTAALRGPKALAKAIEQLS